MFVSPLMTNGLAILISLTRVFDVIGISGEYLHLYYTEDPRYNDSVCYQRFCYKVEFAVIKKLDMDPSKA